MKINQLTSCVIGACIEIHKNLGPGLLENTYESCLCFELDTLRIRYNRQKELPVKYKGHLINCGYRIDLLIDDVLIVELKACDGLLPIHEAQLLTYLKLSGIKLGLLINFNELKLKDGIKRLVY